MTQARHYISSSTPGESMQFATTEDYEAYQAEHRALIQKYRKQNEAKYGYWASNQNKFVKSIEEMNSMDLYTHNKGY